MVLECPGCRAVVSRFDVDETKHCPACGLEFTEATPALEVEPTPPVPLGWPTIFAIILFFLVGSAALTLALIWSKCSHFMN